MSKPTFRRLCLPILLMSLGASPLLAETEPNSTKSVERVRLYSKAVCRCAAPSGIDHHPNTHTLITVATKHRARTHTSWAGLHRPFARTCTRFIVMSL